ncbi:MAG: glycerate kinase [Planctomycetota bacterium]|jgi:glycerate kinase
MRYLIAPDSFKGTLTAVAVAGHLAGGIKAVSPSAAIRVMPLADGGEGTLDAVQWARGGAWVSASFTDPLGRRRKAAYLRLADGRAVIEMARVAGLPLIPTARRDPLVTTTHGVGQMIRHAVDAGAKEILIGMGGSATVDGGSGALSALGVRFLDAAGRSLLRGGGWLRRLQRVKIPAAMKRRFAGVKIRILCDVDNPLLGKDGAARTYGPQKGATPDGVKTLETGLKRFAKVTRSVTGVDLRSVPGAGAAGGLAGGLCAYLGGECVPGARGLMDLTGFAPAVLETELVITGEGCVDETSARGKVVHSVVQASRSAGIPVVAVCGRLGRGFEKIVKGGIASIHACFPPEVPDSPELVYRTPFRLSRIGRTLVHLYEGR